jgi:hypothetical protein
MCDTILTPLPRYVTVAMAKIFESSAPLLKYSRRIRILSLARLEGRESWGSGRRSLGKIAGIPGGR